MRVLEGRGAQVRPVPAEVASGGVDWAELSRSADAAIAAGGDGTVRALAAALTGHELPIGVIPRGTGNVLAEEIGLPRDAEAIADVLMFGPDVRIPGGRVNGEPFFLMAGAGFDGEIVRRLDLQQKRSLGKLAYVPPTLAALRVGDPHLTVEFDGERQTAGWVLVTNAHRYGGSFRLTPRAGLQQSGMIAILFERVGPLSRIRQMLSLGLNRLEGAKGVRLVGVDRIRITANEPVAMEIDGDAARGSVMDIVWGEPTLRLIVPDAYARVFEAGSAAAPT